MSTEKNEVRALGRLNNNIDKLVTDYSAAIPKDINTERLKVNAMMAIAQDATLKQAAIDQPAQMAQVVYNFMTLGLDVYSKEAYIIPRWNKEKGMHDLTTITDYKGEMKLAKKYSIEPIRRIVARAVRENDSYKVDPVTDDFMHEYDPFALNKEKGELIGAYCKIFYENGDVITEFVNLDEINEVKKSSKTAGYASSPWQRFPESMFIKTAIKKALKFVALDYEVTKKLGKVDNDIDFNNSYQKKEKPEAVEPEVLDQTDEPEWDDVDNVVDADFVESDGAVDLTAFS